MDWGSNSLYYDLMLEEEAKVFIFGNTLGITKFSIEGA